MKTTRKTAAITLMIAAALAMAACTPTTPTDPTTSPTASPTATSTPTPTLEAAPTQDPVPAPTTQQEAITGASNTIQQYLAASFALAQNPDLGESYLDGFLVQGSPQAKVIRDTVAHNIEIGLRQTGSPTTWKTNDAMSYASQSTNAATGEKSEFGAAIVYGCADNTSWTFEVPEGQVAPEIPRGSFPNQYTLIYEQTAQVWLIQENVSLRDQDGAPTC